MRSFNPGKGGGIFVSLAGPIIQNNVITDNIAYTGTTPLGIGGGIYLLNCTSSTVISANQIISNTGSTNDWGLGGGLAAQGSSLKILRNEIRNNFADRGGGGIYLHGDGAVILDANTIISNLSTFSPTAQSNGGAIYIEFLSPFTMTNNIIAGNGANFHGGGIYIYGVGSDVSTGSLINNTLVDNKFRRKRRRIIFIWLCNCHPGQQHHRQPFHRVICGPFQRCKILLYAFLSKYHRQHLRSGIDHQPAHYQRARSIVFLSIKLELPSPPTLTRHRRGRSIRIATRSSFRYRR